MQELTRRMARGAVWMVLAKVVDRGIGLVSTIILARLLLPADFGLASLAMAIMAALQLLGAFSFDMALIQHPNAKRQHYDTVWTIGVLFGLFLTVALLVLAYPAAGFFNEPRLSAIMAVLAVMALIGGLANVGTVAFRKEMQFDREFRYLLARRLAVFVVTVTLAYLWRDYWALVAGAVTGTAVGVLISYAMHPYRPRFSLSAWAELFGFSRWLFINNTLSFLYHKSADFMVAKGVGTEGLGNYTIAYEISNLLTLELTQPINRAVFPGYAKMSSDVSQVLQGFTNVLSLMALLIIPAGVGLVCVAAPTVNLVLGDKWSSAVPLVQILALNGILSAILSSSGYVHLAVGKPRHNTLTLCVHLAVAVPLIAWGAFHADLTFVAVALLTASVFLVPLNYWLLRLAVGARVMPLLAILWRPIAGAAVMAIVVDWLSGEVGIGDGLLNHIGGLALLVAAGAAAYTAVVAVLWRLSKCPAGAEQFLLDRIRSRLAATF